MRTNLLLCVILLFVVLVLPASAQDTDNTAPENVAFEMLSLVPDSPEIRNSFLSYTNYTALQATGQHGVIDPDSRLAFDALNELEQGIWNQRLFRAVDIPASTTSIKI